MALEVEDGTGKSNAESYDSVANVSTFLGLYQSAADQATWDALDVAVAETACRRSSLWHDSVLSFGGVRTFTVQALEFPRKRLYLHDAQVFLASNVIPTELKRSMATVSFLDATGVIVLFENAADRQGGIQVERDQVDVLETERRYFASPDGLAPVVGVLGGAGGSIGEGFLHRYLNTRGTPERA